jgi:hypothetical protein
VITDSGTTFSAYYRLNSDEEQGWVPLVSHTLPNGMGPIYGYCDVFPTVSMETGIVE